MYGERSRLVDLKIEFPLSRTTETECKRRVRSFYRKDAYVSDQVCIEDILMSDIRAMREGERSEKR